MEERGAVSEGRHVLTVANLAEHLGLKRRVARTKGRRHD